MNHKLKYRIASFLYKYSFPLYQQLYHLFKIKQDASELSFLKKNVREGDLVLDIGSNIGFYAKVLSELVADSGKVFCFEPDKINFRHLSDNLKGRKNVELINKAVSNQTGPIQIFTSHRLNVDHRTYQPEKFESSYTVDAIAIDDYFATKPRVDVIKMDIQGAEAFALKGMNKILTQNKNILLLMELWPFGLESAGSSAAGLLNSMEEMGFKAFLINKNSGELVSLNLHSLGKGEDDHYNIVFMR